MNGFDDFFDDDLKAPEALKDMLVSEIELIRESMVIVNMFLGEPLKAGLKYLQEFEPKKTNDNE
ncbi:hypothetical protein EGI22_14800 [Lacihabitans sp. LS3-19]|uniref:hypothetical protein n=1 Tax=Lacihabitans sp. LS3-19 TaxID=2487335 RepID=UPI0020CC7C15|nr:hypothetical protein [Lacihabitans sp. LS3-19]MCP9769185.1 hypothetical protein [Lacihabitans sp. LS3-19]